VVTKQTVSLTRDGLSLSNPYEAPEDALELMIAEVFAQVLSVEKVGANDDFFHLGGDSLLAEIISMTILERTGLDFQPSALLEYDSPRKIAALLRGTSGKALVPRYGTREATRPPIFVVHGRGGFTFLKPTFRKGLADGQKLFMFELPGIRGGRCYERIEDIAAIYVKQLVEEHTGGPILLAAFCTGSLIALEMAAQLAKIGRPVHQLVLLDPSLPITEFWLEESLSPRLRISRALARHVPSFLFPISKALLRYIPRFLHELRFRRALEWKRREGRENYSELHFSINARAKLRAAYLCYQPRTFDGPVTILLSSLSDAAVLANDTEVWAQLLPQVRLRVFEGKHGFIADSATPARLLQSIFDAALNPDLVTAKTFEGDPRL
jgi:thioesterase domain-containing protein/acyl carrier protein